MTGFTVTDEMVAEAERAWIKAFCSDSTPTRQSWMRAGLEAAARTAQPARPECICPHYGPGPDGQGEPLPQGTDPTCPKCHPPQLTATREKLTEALARKLHRLDKVQITWDDLDATRRADYEGEAAELAATVLASGVVQEASAQPTPVVARRTTRDVIERALTARHEELSGEASPRDFDGASQILNALLAAGVFKTEAEVRADELEKLAANYSAAVGPDGLHDSLMIRAAAIRAGETNG